jgi:dihydropteroate synthase
MKICLGFQRLPTLDSDYHENMVPEQNVSHWQEQAQSIDTKLSKRHIPLDPAGYFVIYLDRAQGLICARHFLVTVNERGLAIDPSTGKPLNAKAPAPNPLNKIFQAHTAKELCVAIFEQEKPPVVSYLDHAAYLGREFQRAEYALLHNVEYVQD